MSARGMDDDTLFRAAVSAPADVLMQELPDEELIFLDLRSESYFGLDAMGTRMYRALTESASVQEGYERLRSRFDVEPERLRGDLRAFVERLVDRGLLELRA
ncbi:hypothetical protein BH20CHL7_BH20CHL7_03460 [soil metagenome]